MIVYLYSLCHSLDRCPAKSSKINVNEPSSIAASTSIESSSSFLGLLGALDVLASRFLPHISLRLDCCGGGGFVPLGISKNFPVQICVRWWLEAMSALFTESLLAAHRVSDASQMEDACEHVKTHATRSRRIQDL